MSEDKVKVQDTYDFSKNIENVVLSTTYIKGLEDLMMYFIDKMENPSVLTSHFKKFERYIDGTLDLQKEPFTEEEAHLYTIFSLQQLLKGHAYKQGLNISLDATIDQSMVDEMFKAVADNDFDKIKEMNVKMDNHVKDQLS